MTSPVPFIGINFHELEAVLERVVTYYPARPIHLVGMSLGGNYLLRFLMKNWKRSSLTKNIKSLSLVCPPFDVKFVIFNMNKQYQRYFIRYYLELVVLRHEQMKFWWENGIVDLKHMK
jgi:predicted alpha/beta-fold hydrolase